MDKELPISLERDRLLQLSKEQLVDVIMEQALAIQVLKSKIVELEQEIQRLLVSRDLDSQTSSKPPSGDILKKSEKKDSTQVNSSNRENGEGETPKRRPGGQPGHPGKTRKGFGRVDRFEILRPQICSCCNHGSFVAEAYKIETQQVAQLVSRPVKIVEYQRHTCICERCGNLQTADWSPDIIPGQDIGVRLQAFLGWINNYGHLPYEKQQELLWELGKVEIGVGTLVATNSRVEASISQGVDDLKEWIQQTQPNIHSDETPSSMSGWVKQEGKLVSFCDR